MSSSSEYLASLGIDTSDMDKAVSQTVTLLAHLGTQFDELTGKTGTAERALLSNADGMTAAERKTASLKEELYDAAQAFDRLSKAEKAADSNLKSKGEVNKTQTKSEGEFNKYIQTGADNDSYAASAAAKKRDADATKAQTAAQKAQAAETKVQLANEKAFADYLKAGEKNDAYAASAAAKKRDADATKAQVEAQKTLVAETKQSEAARKTELAQMKQTIIDRSKESGATKDQEQNLARLRYAVYDVSNAMAIGGAAAAAFVVGIVGTGVAYEREFADVRRTVGVTGDAADDLYDKFIKISTSIPVAFSSLAEIGTLAGQLGVAEASVASFTETTAQFAATTDVSVEASATAFGRLDELVDGVDGQYKKLASSILNVGINSVATESSIISIASQIAATGNQAGLTADEIIGLSSSLASLGVAPEAARGTILRVFSKINSAVSEGGEKLNDFASISRMTAADFQNGWGSDFTTTFLGFLDGVNSNGREAEAVLRDLGITATRDVSAMLKLAQNSDAVAANLNLAALGYQNTNILAENFGVIAETNASKLQVLGQTVQAFAATLGDASSGPLSHFLDYLQRVLVAMNEFSGTGFGQTVGFIATIMGALVAVMLLIGAATLRTAGSFLALKTALGDTYLKSMLAKGGMSQLTASLFGAAGGAAAFAAALKATGVGLLITGGLYLLGEAIAAIGKSMRSAEERATAYFGTLDGLDEALKQDNVRIFTERQQALDEALTEVAGTGQDWIDVLKSAGEAQDAVASGASSAAGTIDAQTLSIGENTKEWLRNQLATNEAFRSIFTNIEALDRLSADKIDLGGGAELSGFETFDIKAFSDQLANGGVGAGTAYIENFKAGVIAAAEDTGDANVIATAEAFLSNNETLIAAEQAGREVGNALTAGMESAAQDDAVNSILDSAFGSIEDGAEFTGEALSRLIGDVYGVINAEAELASNTRALGADFVNSGAQVASSGSAMQSVISSIYASSSGAPEAANRMMGLFNALVQGGYASASELAGLKAIIDSLAGGGPVVAATFDMQNFAAGIDSVTQAAGGGGSGGGGAAEAVRTLVDYADDLRKVFSRSFDIRFGGSQGADDITSGWLKIKDAVAATTLQISQYQAEMQSLTADKAIREYWLSVAENYGDALRAGQLRAEIAEIDQDLAKSADKLSDAQSDGSKTLVGNSKAAIANRAEILGLVGSYQDYVASLAAAGVPQAELQAKSAQLKADFIAQATQLGYNVSQLGIYAAAFDDVSTAVAKLPRDITVGANVDPAIQALNELQSKIKAVNSGGGVTVPVRTVGSVDAGARNALFTQWATKTQQQYGRALAQSASGWAAVRRMWAEGAYGNPGFRAGGYTGNRPAWEETGTVHGREFVLNQTGTSMFPRQVLDAANQGKQVSFGSPQSAATKFPSVMQVEFSPIDRDLIAQGAQVTVMIGAEDIARSASSAYTNDDHRGAS